MSEQLHHSPIELPLEMQDDGRMAVDAMDAMAIAEKAAADREQQDRARERTEAFVGPLDNPDPETLASAREYFESRPSRPEEVESHDSHYTQSMPRSDKEKHRDELVQEWAEAGLHGDSTRVNDIQDELFDRVSSLKHVSDTEKERMLTAQQKKMESIKASMSGEASAEKSRFDDMTPDEIAAVTPAEFEAMSEADQAAYMSALHTVKDFEHQKAPRVDRNRETKLQDGYKGKNQALLESTKEQEKDFTDLYALSINDPEEYSRVLAGFPENDRGEVAKYVEARRARESAQNSTTGTETSHSDPDAEPAAFPAGEDREAMPSLDEVKAFNALYELRDANSDEWLKQYQSLSPEVQRRYQAFVAAKLASDAMSPRGGNVRVADPEQGQTPGLDAKWSGLYELHGTDRDAYDAEIERLRNENPDAFNEFRRYENQRFMDEQGLQTPEPAPTPAPVLPRRQTPAPDPFEDLDFGGGVHRSEVPDPQQHNVAGGNRTSVPLDMAEQGFEGHLPPEADSATQGGLWNQAWKQGVPGAWRSLVTEGTRNLVARIGNILPLREGESDGQHQRRALVGAAAGNRAVAGQVAQPQPQAPGRRGFLGRRRPENRPAQQGPDPNEDDILS